MPVSVKVVLTGDKKFLAKLEAVASPRVRIKALNEAAFLLAKIAAEEKILRGGRFFGAGGKLTDSPPHPTKLTSRSGRLRGSLHPRQAIDRSGLPKYIEVGTDVKYAAQHELGLAPYPPRPFLKPAAEDVSKELPRIFEKWLTREIDRSG